MLKKNKQTEKTIFVTVVPLQCVPKAADDGGAVRAGDRLPLGAADVVQDVVAALHRHLHPGASLRRVQRPGGRCQVLNVHVVFPQQHQLHLQLSPAFLKSTMITVNNSSEQAGLGAARTLNYLW